MQPNTADIITPSPSSPHLRRILVVDDSVVQLKILSAMLKRWGFEVWQAESAEEALELCEQVVPDAVLSDWMMPGMDGLEFCRRFRALRRDNYGYFILLTSKSEKGEVAAGLDAGADDFLTKPVNSNELRARINAGARILEMERKLTDTLGKLQGAYDAIDRDLRQARTIQQALVPRRHHDYGGARVSLLLKPCGHVGGDLVGFFSPNKFGVGVYSIDVSGHGITSALMTARVAGYLGGDFPDQNIALERRFEKLVAFSPPEEVARRLNDRLSADPGVLEYLTMGYAIIDMGTGRVRLVQAGHPPPLLIHANGSMEYIGNGGLPIGLVPDVSYDRIEIEMQPGDRLLIYSDGITEATLKNGEMLDQSGLVDLVRQCSGALGTEFLDDLYWRLSQLTRGGIILEDDVSAALLEFDGLPAGQTA
ncbi:fused response regulator/phosphatase [Salipiger sp. 1_MG-2023]|uniref:PP2C family protein-serine/threonine phosphatase n=1 Tax=Salipiger sp. 1_MG-2023 TaxID=3062665 RepID=UPI0026E3FD13|nr:fused response regulator/phosphatase [Salipiger sp. 1_MG-2023]MDO6586721.1 fused response regulator/phosphatase [Salipiger sp. 1_MG-2023]